jgi:hypothetical protein
VYVAFPVGAGHARLMSQSVSVEDVLAPREQVFEHLDARDHLRRGVGGYLQVVPAQDVADGERRRVARDQRRLVAMDDVDGEPTTAVELLEEVRLLGDAETLVTEDPDAGHDAALQLARLHQLVVQQGSGLPRRAVEQPVLAVAAEAAEQPLTEDLVPVPRHRLDPTPALPVLRLVGTVDLELLGMHPLRFPGLHKHRLEIVWTLGGDGGGR